MTTIELARRCAQLGQEEDAVKAYSLAVEDELSPRDRFECAAYILQHGGDYKISYTAFVQLYNGGYNRKKLLEIMNEAFYEPNVRMLKNRYERNCKLLRKYPYFLHEEEFVPFDKLPLVFYPYDDNNGYVPYDTAAEQFRGFVNIKDAVISHYFFKDLEKPILASDIYSQYELEYLVDNVRPSEWVAKENHIYLHYADWGEFCSYLTVLNMKPLVESKKVVFLIGDELSQYPIDFKERFGIDYSQYTVQPIHIREVNKLIWHTQFSSSNGGDFFNEVFDAHPNLIMRPSVMFDTAMNALSDIRESLRESPALEVAQKCFEKWKAPELVRELYTMRNLTDKDVLVAIFLREEEWQTGLDRSARIAPALFFQPHFHNLWFSIRANKYDRATLSEEHLDELDKSRVFRDFKYIKTFTPLRRFTTTYGSTLRFMYKRTFNEHQVVPDLLMQRILNRSYMRDKEDRLHHDEVVVRFEDGKLNPRATFSALAEFLDIPYTESMTYCSIKGEHDVVSEEGNAVGFDPVTVYKKYEDWMNDSERYFLEYFMRDAYEYYGYDFEIYDGAPVDDEKVKELAEHFDILDHYIEETTRKWYIEENLGDFDKESMTDEQKAEAMAACEIALKLQKEDRMKLRLHIAGVLQHGLHFVNSRKQPLEFTPLLKLDPALLERPIYHGGEKPE